MAMLHGIDMLRKGVKRGAEKITFFVVLEDKSCQPITFILLTADC